MASDSAWHAGIDIAKGNIAARRERKQALADEERKLKVTDLYDKGHKLSALIPSLSGADRDKAMSQLTDIEQSLAAVYHPDRNPGAIQRDWDFVSDLLRRKPRSQALTNVQYDSATTPDLTLPAQKQADQPAAVTATTLQLPSAAITMPGGRSVDVRPAQAAMTPQQRQQMAKRDKARAAAQLDVASAGLSPEEEAAVTGRKNLATIVQARKDFRAANPDATPTQEAAFMQDVMGKTYGVTQRPVYKEFVDQNGNKDWLDVTQPVPPGMTAVGTENTDTRKRADYAAYLKQHPEYEVQGGNYEKWIVTQGQIAKRETPAGRDDRFIAIQQKRELGQPLSDDDKAYGAAYDLYINKRVIDPILARAAAQGANRYVQVMDPNDPEKVIFMRAQDAAVAGAGTPASISFQTDKAMTKYMTSGKGGENIAAFSTASSHLKLLNEVGIALQNGDVQLLNQFGNTFATATGDPAPTNFEAVKNAVSGEISKVFTGRGATVEEIAQINKTISSAQSPEQIMGAIKYYTDLMDGKLDALRAQFALGKQGQPAFPAVSPTGGGGTTKTASAGAGSVNLSAAIERYKRNHPGEKNVTKQMVIDDLNKYNVPYSDDVK